MRGENKALRISTRLANTHCNMYFYFENSNQASTGLCNMKWRLYIDTGGVPYNATPCNSVTA